MNKIYYPVLKWKSGEKRALRKVGLNMTKNIRPIIEIIDDIEPKVFMDELSAYDHFESFFIDSLYLDEGEPGFLENLIKGDYTSNKKIIPVLDYHDFKIRYENFSNHTNEFLVKIPIPADFEGDNYDEMFSYLNSIEKQGVKIIYYLSLGLITDRNTANYKYNEVKNVLSNHFSNTDSENIIISCTSFPGNFSDINSGENKKYYRYDIKIFKQLLKDINDAQLTRKLSFSDYGVTKFTESEIDFSRLRYGVLPKARYTLDDYYWILKGKRDNLTGEIIINHHVLAKKIYDSKHYYGKDFSFGDLEILERAQKHKDNDPNTKVGPGNNTNWVTIDVSHHLAVVVKQLSS